MKTTRYVDQGNWSCSQDFNTESPAYEAGILLIHLQSSVTNTQNETYAQLLDSDSTMLRIQEKIGWAILHEGHY
jgi:hypothetical protein